MVLLGNHDIQALIQAFVECFVVEASFITQIDSLAVHSFTVAFEVSSFIGFIEELIGEACDFGSLLLVVTDALGSATLNHEQVVSYLFHLISEFLTKRRNGVRFTMGFADHPILAVMRIRIDGAIRMKESDSVKRKELLVTDYPK